MSWQALSIGGYLIVQLAICVWISRKIKSENDYFLAGRSLGLGFASISIFATWFGAETCMGSSAAIFEEGLSGSRADPFGYSICLFLMGVFLARPLWKKKIITLADLYRKRYGSFVEKLAVWVIVPASLIWAAAQVRAFGQIVSVVTPFDVSTAIAFATGMVILYTFLGGLMGDVITDVIQGSILIVGLVALLFFAFWDLGGVNAAIQSIPAESFHFVAEGESLWARLDSWMIPILGSLIAQELISRVLASKSASVAQRASFVSCGIYLFVGLVPVTIGLLGSQFNLAYEQSDQFLPLLAQQLMPPVFFVIFAGALISAILSTVDSTLLSISALVSHNFVSPLFRVKTEKQKVKIARYVVVGAGLATYFLAERAESIYDLVEMASSFGAGGILCITFLGLYTRFGGIKAASVSLIVGVFTTPLYEYVLEFEAPFLAAVFTSLVVYVAVALAMGEWRVSETLSEPAPSS